LRTTFSGLLAERSKYFSYKLISFAAPFGIYCLRQPHDPPPLLRHQTALSANLLYRTSLKSDNKCRQNGRKFTDAVKCGFQYNDFHETLDAIIPLAATSCASFTEMRTNAYIHSRPYVEQRNICHRIDFHELRNFSKKLRRDNRIPNCTEILRRKCRYRLISALK
jgi:hypothetical protein